MPNGVWKSNENRHKCNKGGRPPTQDAKWYLALTPTEKNLYWRAYQRGYTAGAKRDLNHKLTTEIISLRQMIIKLTKN